MHPCNRRNQHGIISFESLQPVVNLLRHAVVVGVRQPHQVGIS